MQVPAGLCLTDYQARWAQPPVRIILKQLATEYGRFYLRPGDAFSQRLLGRVKRNLDLSFVYRLPQQIQNRRCVQFNSPSIPTSTTLPALLFLGIMLQRSDCVKPNH